MQSKTISRCSNAGDAHCPVCLVPRAAGSISATFRCCRLCSELVPYVQCRSWPEIATECAVVEDILSKNDTGD